MIKYIKEIKENHGQWRTMVDMLARNIMEQDDEFKKRFREFAESKYVGESMVRPFFGDNDEAYDFWYERIVDYACKTEGNEKDESQKEYLANITILDRNMVVGADIHRMIRINFLDGDLKGWKPLGLIFDRPSEKQIKEMVEAEKQ